MAAHALPGIGSFRSCMGIPDGRAGSPGRLRPRSACSTAPHRRVATRGARSAAAVPGTRPAVRDSHSAEPPRRIVPGARALLAQHPDPRADPWFGRAGSLHAIQLALGAWPYRMPAPRPRGLVCDPGSEHPRPRPRWAASGQQALAGGHRASNPAVVRQCCRETDRNPPKTADRPLMRPTPERA